MTKEEDRILHGLYSFREIINERIPVTGDELLWLAKHTLREGRQWHTGEKFQTMDRSQRPNEIAFRGHTAEQERPLRFLAAKGLIEITETKGSMKIYAVTAAGAERARRLQTWYGRLDLWYLDRRDGVVSLWVPAIVAILTSILTTWILHRLGER